MAIQNAEFVAYRPNYSRWGRSWSLFAWLLNGDSGSWQIRVAPRHRIAPTLSVVAIVFGSQATTYVVRSRQHLWGLRPSTWLVFSSVVDVLIISTLALLGIAMTRLPIAIITGEFVAAIIFGVVMDLVKIPLFARLHIS